MYGLAYKSAASFQFDQVSKIRINSLEDVKMAVDAGLLKEETILHIANVIDKTCGFSAQGQG